ncbi:MAG: hypothetical protein AAGF11_13110 [Myxococcota bacterium]
MVPTPRIHHLAPAGVLLSILCGLGGCMAQDDDSDPIVGSWRSADRIGGEYNEMEIDEDLEGEATIFYYQEGQFFYAEFDVTIDPEGGDDYEIEFECIDGCGSLDFQTDCELDDDELECRADGDWESYEFEWEID